MEYDIGIDIVVKVKVFHDTIKKEKLFFYDFDLFSSSVICLINFVTTSSHSKTTIY